MTELTEQIRRRTSLEAELLAAQNADGGWGYAGQISWTEPTALAVLGLTAEQRNAAAAGLRWLQRMQRTDGGWPPKPGVEESTWVTALAVLALNRTTSLNSDGGGVKWLMRQTRRESSWIVRLRQALLGSASEVSTEHRGWPWFPGAAAWVMPSALGILALKSLRAVSPAVQARIGEGQRFLLSRVCADGGWNHGTSRALGYDGASYPETTGVALLALHGTEPSQLQSSIACAERHLATCRSRSAASWLRLGLLAHSKMPPKCPAEDLPPRTVGDLAVALIAERAIGGANVLL